MSDADAPVHVIGLGEVGRRFAAALRTAGRRVHEVRRDSGWPEALAPGPAWRLVAVREDDLPDVLERLRPVPDECLILVQNGWLRPLLTGRPAVTRGLIWFTAKGDFFRVLRSSPFAGPAAAALAAQLAGSGLDIAAVDDATFAREDAEKMGFNCVVGLPLAVHGLSLGEYLQQRSAEAEAVFNEAVTVCAEAVGATPDAAAWPRFVRLVEPLHWVRASRAKALDWRNGAVVRLAATLGLQAPHNRALLAVAGWSDRSADDSA